MTFHQRSHLLHSFPSFFKLSLICFMVLSCSAHKKVKKEIKSTIESQTFKQGFTGIAVYDPQKEKMLFEFNSDKYFTPASNTKLFTFYTGLKFLGDSITSLHYRISGDSLIFSSAGDPSFLNPEFDNTALLDFFKKEYSEKNLYYIKANWQDKHFGPGWAWDDYNEYYSADKSAFPVYGNLMEVDYSANSLQLQPDIFTDSINFIESSEGIIRGLDDNQFKIGKTSEEFSSSIPFKTSEELSVKLLGLQIEKPIVILNDHNYLKNLNQDLFITPADTLYQEMLLQSDNFIAEQILLMVSQKISDTLKTNIAIDEMQKKYLGDLPDKFYWKDGSGLSRYNLVTPRSMIKILEKILSEKSRDVLFQLLPSAGKTGTLKNMFKGQDIQIYAKTGSLSNNFSLSGYMISKSGKLLLFSFMNSNYTVNSTELKSGIQQILLKFINNY